MRRTDRQQFIAQLLGLLAVVMALAACASSNSPQVDQATDELEFRQADEADTTTSSTTTTAAPQPPQIDVPSTTFVEVGQAISHAVVVSDQNGDDTVVRLLENGAPGLVPVTNVRGRIIGFDWEPSEAGEWDVIVTATDPGGLSTQAVVRLVARNRPSSDMLLAMGDSIAAGFGRDRSDFAGGDECFRSEDDSYAAVAFEELISAGALEAEAELIIVACAGVDAAELSTLPTVATNAAGEVVGEPLSQLERATLLNPTIVTLTVGAPEAGLFELEDLLEPRGSEETPRAIDQDGLDRRLATIRQGLNEAFDVLMTTTSAHVVLTTAYNPVATNPVGVDGCRGQCMVAASDVFVDGLNEMLLEVAQAQREGRVSIARLDGEADVWEAPNGAGIDALRDGLGPLQGIVDTVTGGSNALCADDAGVGDSLVSSLDCAHPNSDGQRAIADVVISELLSI